MAQSYFTAVTVSGDIEQPSLHNSYNVECSGTYQNSSIVILESPIAMLSEHQVYQLVRDIQRARRLFRAAQKADRS